MKTPAPVLEQSKFTDAQPEATPEVMPEVVAGEDHNLSESVFFPNWYNKPAEVKPVVTYNGVSILTAENTALLIASPGMGKSNNCEALVTSYLAPEADSLGYGVADDCEGVIFIDNERTRQDVWNSFYRICRRANIPEGSPLKNTVIAGLRAIPRLDQRLAEIETLLENNPCSLLIIDGLGDLVTDTNDLPQAIECRIWLRETTSKYRVSIFSTIHPNPGSFKPRGHIGSEGHREAECVLLAKTLENDIRIITTDFEYGKNRNNGHITGGYTWSDERKMFVTVPEETIIQLGSSRTASGKAKLKAELLATKTLPPPNARTFTELLNKIIEVDDCSESTAKRRIKEMEGFNLIHKHDDGYYRQVS